jgi:hypothetical protein
VVMSNNGPQNGDTLRPGGGWKPKGLHSVHYTHLSLTQPTAIQDTMFPG